MGSGLVNGVSGLHPSGRSRRPVIYSKRHISFPTPKTLAKSTNFELVISLLDVPAQAILAAQRRLRKWRDGRGHLLTVCPPVRSAETLTPSPIAPGSDCTSRSKAARTPRSPDRQRERGRLSTLAGGGLRFHPR